VDLEPLLQPQQLAQDLVDLEPLLQPQLLVQDLVDSADLVPRLQHRLPPQLHLVGLVPMQQSLLLDLVAV
jgi:hypothetical protein